MLRTIWGRPKLVPGSQASARCRRSYSGLCEANFVFRQGIGRGSKQHGPYLHTARVSPHATPCRPTSTATSAMTIRMVGKFTPEVLLGSARRSDGVPNPSGTHAVYGESTYSFRKHSKSAEIRLLDLSGGDSTLVVDGEEYSNPVWIDDESIALLHSGKDGKTELVIGPVSSFTSASYVAGVIDGPVDNLKITRLANGNWGVAVTGEAGLNGRIYNPSAASKPKSSGRVYDSLFVRHWDRYVTPQKNSIFCGTLSHSPARAHRGDLRWSLSPLNNILAGTGLESPIPTFGGKDHFDIASSGVAFVAKDPVLDPALNTKCNVYFVPLTTFREEEPVVQTTHFPGIDGALTSPVLSADGVSLALLAMKENGAETDWNRIIVIPDVQYFGQVKPAAAMRQGFSLSPSSLTWADDKSALFLIAEFVGTAALFVHDIDLDSVEEPGPPRLLYNQTSVQDVRLLPSLGADKSRKRLFLSGSSLVESKVFATLVLATKPDALSIMTTFRQAQGGAMAGLSQSQVLKIHTDAADPSIAFNGKIESWVVRPSGFDPSQRYPLALLVHGGPQGAWTNSWSTRWNPAVFAEQGYVVVCPNITGSTGYGPALTEGIVEQWGGLPYKDLEILFEHLETSPELDYIDTGRAVCLGASYGGYMANWIQGQPLGRKFKALVTHDGVFSSRFMPATDELYFIQHDFGGGFSTHNPVLDKWDPARFTENWSTPNLIIHSDKDYRLSVVEGLAAFNTLQARGVPSRFLNFPDENHWVLSPENSLVWHRAVLAWINEHTGLPAYVDGYEGETHAAEVAFAAPARRAPVVVGPRK